MCFPRAGGDVPRVLEAQELQEALARLRHSQRSGRKRRADRAAAEALEGFEIQLADDEEEGASGLDQADRPVVPGVSSRADRASGRASRASASEEDRASGPAYAESVPVVLAQADRPGVPGPLGRVTRASSLASRDSAPSTPRVQSLPSLRDRVLKAATLRVVVERLPETDVGEGTSGAGGVASGVQSSGPPVETSSLHDISMGFSDVSGLGEFDERWLDLLDSETETRNTSTPLVPPSTAEPAACAQSALSEASVAEPVPVQLFCHAVGVADAVATSSRVAGGHPVSLQEVMLPTLRGLQEVVETLGVVEGPRDAPRPSPGCLVPPAQDVSLPPCLPSTSGSEAVTFVTVVIPPPVEFRDVEVPVVQAWGLENFLRQLPAVTVPKPSSSLGAESGGEDPGDDFDDDAEYFGDEALPNSRKRQGDFEIVGHSVRCRYPFGMSPWSAATVLRGYPQAATDDILIALMNIGRPGATWEDWKGAYLLMEGAVVGQKDLAVHLFPHLQAAWAALMGGGPWEKVVEELGFAMGILGPVVNRPRQAQGQAVFEPPAAPARDVPAPAPAPEGPAAPTLEEEPIASAAEEGSATTYYGQPAPDSPVPAAMEEDSAVLDQEGYESEEDYDVIHYDDVSDQ